MKSKKRTVMIFPEFDNMKYIDELREKYDPLADKVHPHITLVFPFKSTLSVNEIEVILDKRLSEIKPFEITLQQLSVSDCWLLLNLTEGIDTLTEIHNILYNAEFSDYKPLWLNKYIPHMTVGKSSSVEEARNVYEKEKNFNEIFNCLTDKVSVEIIGDDEESIIESEYRLRSK